MNHLQKLESKSIYILREAQACFKNLGMLWSIGKDSTVLLHLTRKAFFGKIPFPIVHIDTSFKIPEMITYRNQMAVKYGFDLIVGKNEAAISEKQTFPDGNCDRIKCCKNLKTDALTATLSGKGVRWKLNHKTLDLEKWPYNEPFEGMILGIRADEEGSRSKERYFSPRSELNKWAIREQPPEIWNQFKTEFAPGTHIRVHPLLDWTEQNIWEYILEEKIETVSLYYNHSNKSRYRSLGCGPCTQPILSQAVNAEQIVEEFKSGVYAKIPERSGRAQDSEDGGGLQSLRQEGYM